MKPVEISGQTGVNTNSLPNQNSYVDSQGAQLSPEHLKLIQEVEKIEQQDNFLNLDLSAIGWKDTTPIASGGMNNEKSMIDSIIFEFQDYVGRRSSSAPRKSNEAKDKHANEKLVQEEDNNSESQSLKSSKRRNFKEWLENKKA